MNKKLKDLLSILINKEASISDRDDAAMDLDEYDDNDVLEALIIVAKDETEDHVILNSCGESIGSIWVRRNIFDKASYDELSKMAQVGVKYVIQAERPEWLRLL